MTDLESRSKTRSLIKVESLFPNSIDVSEFITKEFDYIVKTDLYNHDGKCLTYDFMRTIAQDERTQIQRPLIVLSPDTAVSSATISGNAERHMHRTGVKDNLNGKTVDGIDFQSDLCVLYISSKLGLCTESYDGISSYQRSVMSNAIGLTSQSFTKHNLNIDPGNVIYLGIRSDLIEDDEQNALDSMSRRPLIFDLERIRSKGINRIMNFVRNRFKNKKVQIVFDMSAIDISLAPSVFRYRAVSIEDEETGTNRVETPEEISHNFRGLNKDEVLEIMRYATMVKEDSNLEEFDLTGYNFSVEEYRDQAQPANLLTSKVMIDILKCVSDFTDHSINIFDESSRFLIWKKIPPVFDDNDDVGDLDRVGWYILRGVDLETRNSLISHFHQAKLETSSTTPSADQNADSSMSAEAGVDFDKEIDRSLAELEYPIERFEFPDGDEVLDVLISVTSPMEQNLKSYYTATSYLDRCLLPGEKVNMTFELLATPSAIRTLNEQADNADEDNGNNGDDDIELLEDTSVSGNSNSNNADADDDSVTGVNPSDLEELRMMYDQYRSVVNGTKDSITETESVKINTQEISENTEKRVRFDV